MTYLENKYFQTKKGDKQSKYVFITTYILIMAHAFPAAIIAIIFGPITFNLLFSFYNLNVWDVKNANKNFKNSLCTFIFVPHISAPLNVSIAFMAESLSAYFTQPHDLFGKKYKSIRPGQHENIFFKIATGTAWKEIAIMSNNSFTIRSVG